MAPMPFVLDEFYFFSPEKKQHSCLNDLWNALSPPIHERAFSSQKCRSKRWTHESADGLREGTRKVYQNMFDGSGPLPALPEKLCLSVVTHFTEAVCRLRCLLPLPQNSDYARSKKNVYVRPVD